MHPPGGSGKNREVETASVDQAFLRFRKIGDASALGEVFDVVAPSLLLVAARLAPPGIEAEDLLQQTFLDAIRHRDRYEPGRPLTS